MRVIAEIPHSHLKITVFEWNERYVIKFEIGQFEQTYKIGITDINGLSDVKSMLTEDFLEKVMLRFVDMRKDFQETFSTNI